MRISRLFATNDQGTHSFYNLEKLGPAHENGSGPKSGPLHSGRDLGLQGVLNFRVLLTRLQSLSIILVSTTLVLFFLPMSSVGPAHENGSGPTSGPLP